MYHHLGSAASRRERTSGDRRAQSRGAKSRAVSKRAGFRPHLKKLKTAWAMGFAGTADWAFMAVGFVEAQPSSKAASRSSRLLKYQ